MAKQFAFSFGVDAYKNREAMTALHCYCVSFVTSANRGVAEDDPSVPPTHFAFFEILNEFTDKLLNEDKKIMYAAFFMVVFTFLKLNLLFDL